VRALRTVLAASLLLVGASLPAFADHTHVMATGNGRCVVLAPDGGEKYVELPHADEFAENRRHPLHVNVHLGEPGSHGGIWVHGSAGDLANCNGYVNS
jgi:hypothetical protein